MMERSRADRWSDWAITGLLYAIAVTGPLLMGGLREQDFFWIELLTVCAGVLAIFRLVVVRDIRMFAPAILWCALAFTIYAVVRYATADLEYVARKELIWVLTYLLIFYLALNHLNEPRRVLIFFGILLVVAMGMCLFALRQHITGTNQVWHLIRPTYTFRGSGTYIYPNHFAGFLELLIPFGVASLFLGPFKGKTKLAIAYCTVWMLIGLYVSLSRAGWAAGLLALLALLPLALRNRRTWVWAFFIMVGLLMGGLGWELKTGQIRQRFETMHGDNPTTDISMRAGIWKAAGKVWREEPWLGAGPGHFDHRFRPYRAKIMQMRPGRAHNDYLDLLADWGIAGAIPILLALGLALWRAGRDWLRAFLAPQETPTAERLIAVAAGAGLLAIAAHAFVDYQMHVPANAILATLFAAIVVGNGVAPDRLIPLGRFRWAAAATLIAIAGVLIYQAPKALRERKLLDKAAQQSGVEKIATLKKAFALEPANFDTAYWLGESYRAWSWQGADDYREHAEEAIGWFEKATALNRFDPYPVMRLGMCLDWLRRHDEAEPYFLKALQLDPMNHVIVAHLGWHFFQKEDYRRAKEWFIKSWEIYSVNNPMVETYVRLIAEREKK